MEQHLVCFSPNSFTYERSKRVLTVLENTINLISKIGGKEDIAYELCEQYDEMDTEYDLFRDGKEL